MNTLEQLRSGSLLGATRLVLSEGLTEFPREIFSLAATLEYLDLSGNSLSALPDDFACLQELKVLFCAGNRFTELPVVLGQCQRLSMVGFRSNQLVRIEGRALPPKLRWLILTGNQLTDLPPELGSCAALQKLALSGNRLSTLPPEMAACKNLELLRIAANRFEVLPGWLLQLPKLSWLGFSGNPLCAAAEARALQQSAAGPATEPQALAAAQASERLSLAQVPWSSVTLKQKLGEGASGLIYQATQAGHLQDVAIKVFKGALTSDGLPHSEMAAYLSAGSHPYLINLLGNVTGHPDGTEALLMQLVPESYRNLAAPPSLDSCTRDVYGEACKFSLPEALLLAHGMASLAQQLHSKSLTHGDLYAHNILLGQQGHAVLGDFGAAAFYDQQDPAVAQAIQQIEARAFGCLLQELLERVELDAQEAKHWQHVLQNAQLLRDQCLRPDVANRPLFETLEARLADWSGACLNTQTNVPGCL